MTFDTAKTRAICNAATSGDWHAADCISPQIVLYAVPADKAKLRQVGEGDLLYLGRVYADGKGQGRANLKFIAHARTALPEACSRIEALERALASIVERWDAADNNESIRALLDEVRALLPATKEQP